MIASIAIFSATVLPFDRLLGEVSRWHVDIGPRWPWWLIGMLVSLAIAGAVLMYANERIAPQRKRFLMVLRSLSLVAIAWMLWGWMISRDLVQLPELWILVDHSESMQLPGSEVKQTRWDQAWNRLQSNGMTKALEQHYQPRFFFFGSGIQELNPSDRTVANATPNVPASRLGEDLSTLLSSAANEPMVGIWLLSDGQVTQGRRLVDALGSNLNETPIFVTPLGNDLPPLDVAIRETQIPSTVIPGDDIEAVVTVVHPQELSKPLQVSLLDEAGRLLDQRTVERNPSSMRSVVTLRTTLTTSGRQSLRVQAESLPGETDVANNAAEVNVTVREEPLRVLLIADSPNYEFRFLKHLLERSTGPDTNKPWLKLTSVLQQGDPRYADQDRSAVRLPPVDEAALDAIDVVVLIDANPEGLGRLLLERLATRIDERGMGMLIIAGPRHLPGDLRGTPLSKMSPVLLSANESSDAAERWSGSWQLRRTPFGEVEKAMELPEQAWDHMPPVQFMISPSTIATTAQVLVEGVSNEGPATPAIVTQRFGSGTIQLHLTDEFFRLASTGENDQPHERFWLQSLRRLARGRHAAAPDYLEITAQPSQIENGQPVRLEAHLGSDLIKAAEGRVQLQLRSFADTKGEPSERLVTLAIDANDPRHWSGEIESLPTGKWKVSLHHPEIASGSAGADVEVLGPPSELTRSHADREALEELSTVTKGAVLEVNANVSEVVSRLPKTEPISRKRMPQEPLWNHPLAMLLVSGLLITEWALRRWWNLP